MEYISGVVERITFENEDNGFSVIKIKSKGYADLITVIGSLAAVNVGSVIRLKGQERVKPQRQSFVLSDFLLFTMLTLSATFRYCVQCNEEKRER